MDILQVSKLLLDHYMDASDPTSLKRLLEARNPSGMTALLVAVEQSDFPLIELFIGAGADLKAVDENGDTALIHASMTASKENCNQLKEFLSPTLLKVNNFLYIMNILLLKCFYTFISGIGEVSGTILYWLPNREGFQLDYGQLFRL